MGIPRFFIQLLKKYRNTHFWDPAFKAQIFLMDYNAFIHNALHEFLKQKKYDEFEKLTVSKREDEFTNFIVKKTIDFVNEVAKPEKLLYIAFDGPVPKSKMLESRARRYKAVKQEEYLDELRKTFKVDKDVSSLFSNVSISPGTTLMEKISKGLWTTINKKKFMGGNIIAILDDTHIPGEGEHKILKFIRYLKNLEDKVCIYSPDADVIVLSLQYKGDIYNIREKRFDSKEDLQLYPNPDVKYIIFSITKYREALKKEFGNVDEFKLSRDLIFISFFIGNDFIKAIYFVKSNKDGFGTVLDIYKKVRKDRYLVSTRVDDKVYPVINNAFLIEMISELSKLEDSSMKEYQNRLFSQMNKESEKVEQTFETKKSSFIHDYYYSPTNPFYEPGLFKMINYNKPKSVWNQEYYSYFFGIKDTKYKKMICRTYLEGLYYCIHYYLIDLPSWKWYYPFRVAPMPSDLLQYLNENPLDFHFELGEPYTPIEQLALMLPPQRISMLPKPLRTLITNETSPLIPYYPIDFKLDKVFGEKFEYAKPLLPVFVDKLVLPSIRDTFDKFTKAEKERNELKDTYQVYQPTALKELLLDIPRTIDIV